MNYWIQQLRGLSASKTVTILSKNDWNCIGKNWRDEFLSQAQAQRVIPYGSDATFVLYHFGESIGVQDFTRDKSWVKILFWNFVLKLLTTLTPYLFYLNTCNDLTSGNTYIILFPVPDFSRKAGSPYITCCKRLVCSKQCFVVPTSSNSYEIKM